MTDSIRKVLCQKEVKNEASGSGDGRHSKKTLFNPHRRFVYLAAHACIPPRGTQFFRSTDADGRRNIAPRPSKAKTSTA